MMMGHTPGPWRHSGRKGGWDGVTSADGTDICALEYNNPANASLIAAAPDLLELLTRARTWIAEEIENIGPCDHSVNLCVCGDRALVDEIDAAIAKATT